MGFQLMSGIIRAKAAEPIRALTDKDVSDPDSGIVDFEDIRGNRIDDGFTVSIIDGVAYSVTEDSSGLILPGKRLSLKVRTPLIQAEAKSLNGKTTEDSMTMTLSILFRTDSDTVQGVGYRN